jgi:ABC-type lipoprotein release transport system permease subunit
VLVGTFIGRGRLTALNSVNTANGAEAFALNLPVAGIVIGLVGGLLLTTLASLLPTRRAARVDIVAALRYE